MIICNCGNVHKYTAKYLDFDLSTVNTFSTNFLLVLVLKYCPYLLYLYLHLNILPVLVLALKYYPLYLNPSLLPSPPPPG